MPIDADSVNVLANSNNTATVDNFQFKIGFIERDGASAVGDVAIALRGDVDLHAVVPQLVDLLTRGLDPAREELERVPGLPRKVAREIYAHLHKAG